MWVRRGAGGLLSPAGREAVHGGSRAGPRGSGAAGRAAGQAEGGEGPPGPHPQGGQPVPGAGHPGAPDAAGRPRGALPHLGGPRGQAREGPGNPGGSEGQAWGGGEPEAPWRERAPGLLSPSPTSSWSAGWTCRACALAPHGQGGGTRDCQTPLWRHIPCLANTKSARVGGQCGRFGHPDSCSAHTRLTLPSLACHLG